MNNINGNNKLFKRHDSEENMPQRERIPNISKDERPGCRPRGRLNFYDSDTFSENFVINGNAQNKNFKKNGKFKK